MAKDKASDLTDKQLLFCQEYLKDLNGTQAAIRAGYSAKSANEIAAENLAKLSIQSKVQELKNERSERCEITADMILKELASIGFSKITDFLKIEEVDKPIGEDDEEGRPITINMKDVIVFDTASIPKDKIPAISEIKMTRDGISLKLHDKIAALEKIAKHIGFFEVDNKQKTDIPKSFNVQIIPPND
jgi:phage terminase small subunit